METNGKWIDQELHVLIQRLKNEDGRYAEISKGFQIVYRVLIPLYSLLMVRHIILGDSIMDIAGSFCLLCSMALFALLFRYYYREYKSVDYAQPTLVMLKEAARRYQPFSGKVWLAMAAVLLINAFLSLRSSFESVSDFVWMQVAFFGVMIGALLVGLLVWRIRYKPIRDEALRMICEIRYLCD
jgi:hypothetical protein